MQTSRFQVEFVGLSPPLTKSDRVAFLAFLPTFYSIGAGVSVTRWVGKPDPDP